MIDIIETLSTVCIDLEDALEQHDWDVVSTVFDELSELVYNLERDTHTEDY